MKRDGSPVVLQFLAERIRKACEAANLHPHREILALNVGSANLRFILVTADVKPLLFYQQRTTGHYRMRRRERARGGALLDRQFSQPA